MKISLNFCAVHNVLSLCCISVGITWIAIMQIYRQKMLLHIHGFINCMFNFFRRHKTQTTNLTRGSGQKKVIEPHKRKVAEKVSQKTYTKSHTHTHVAQVFACTASGLCVGCLQWPQLCRLTPWCDPDGTSDRRSRCSRGATTYCTSPS